MFLENVWWPSFGSFLDLYPEYEVADFKDGHRFLDFAYIRPPYKICLEVDGFGPHLRDITRGQFADQLMRQNHLMIDNWIVIRFSVDDVKDSPRKCQQIVQQMLGKLFGNHEAEYHLTAEEREVLRLAARSRSPITPHQVMEELDICGKHARKLLAELVTKNLLFPASGIKRIRSYRLVTAVRFLE